MTQKLIRIGGASGFWGDSSIAVPQLLTRGKVDYIVFDFLAEVTMSILSAAKLKEPSLGYATDFVRTVRENLRDIKRQGVRLIANAGGVNPRACAEAIKAAAKELGVSIKVAFVEGDSALDLIPGLREEGVGEIQDGRPLPNEILTANAYIGAGPIKAALDAGAEIVVTGRCVDSAVTLGALMHEFGWRFDELDKLAQASMAGHIIECGCQATGGLYTDWREVPDWANIGYPILECRADGGFVVTKADGTGGLVTIGTVAEQVLYEVGDPQRYILPDVICDFSNISLAQESDNRVSVRNVRGLPPTPYYKVSATYRNGFKCTAQLTIVGFEAVDKARRTGEAILERTRGIFRQKNLGDYTHTNLEVLGSESGFGPHSVARDVREVILQLAVRHENKKALEIFASEVAPAGCAFAPGTTGITGRPSVSPAIEQYAFLLRKSRLSLTVVVDDKTLLVSIPETDGSTTQISTQSSIVETETLSHGGELVEVPLISIAHGRSGDKGNISNIGLIARTPELLPYLRTQVTPRAVKEYLGHLVLGDVTRYEVPGLNAFNFLCDQALGGGGMASLRNDPYGKGMAQIALSMPVRVPRKLIPQRG